MFDFVTKKTRMSLDAQKGIRTMLLKRRYRITLILENTHLKIEIWASELCFRINFRLNFKKVKILTWQENFNDYTIGSSLSIPQDKSSKRVTILE